MLRNCLGCGISWFMYVVFSQESNSMCAQLLILKSLLLQQSTLSRSLDLVSSLQYTIYNTHSPTSSHSAPEPPLCAVSDSWPFEGSRVGSSDTFLWLFGLLHFWFLRFMRCYQCLHDFTHLTLTHVGFKGSSSLENSDLSSDHINLLPLNFMYCICHSCPQRAIIFILIIFVFTKVFSIWGFTVR